VYLCRAYSACNDVFVCLQVAAIMCCTPDALLKNPSWPLFSQVRLGAADNWPHDDDPRQKSVLKRDSNTLRRWAFALPVGTAIPDGSMYDIAEKLLTHVQVGV
jgi:hypothetical protein